MTFIQTRAITPHCASYEVSPLPTPIRYEDSAQALFKPRAMAGSALSMATQQRGPFAAHAHLVNPTQPSRLTLLNESLRPLERSVMLGKVDQVVTNLGSEPSSPPPPTRLSALNEGFTHLERSAMLGEVDQVVTNLGFEPSSPPPPTRLSALNEGFTHLERSVMLDKVDQFVAGLSS